MRGKPSRVQMEGAPGRVRNVFMITNPVVFGEIAGGSIARKA